MINISIDSKDVTRMLAIFPKEAGRAAEIALDKTAENIRDGIQGTMKRVFDRPTRYTLNSLKINYTKNHNLQASVWFKEPERMSEHYLVPQVEGGTRKLKGFERALWHQKFIPGEGVKLNQYGNISPGLLIQIKSVLGRAELTAGYQANVTKKSAKRNIKQRDFVYLPKGSSNGALPPGVYKRVAQSRRGLNSAKFRRSQASFGTYQKGKTVGKISSIIRARGLKPILLVGRKNKPVKPLLPFYEIANKVYDRKFHVHFDREFSKLMSQL